MTASNITPHPRPCCTATQQRHAGHEPACSHDVVCPSNCPALPASASPPPITPVVPLYFTHHRSVTQGMDLAYRHNPMALKVPCLAQGRAVWAQCPCPATASPRLSSQFSPPFPLAPQECHAGFGHGVQHTQVLQRQRRHRPAAWARDNSGPLLLRYQFKRSLPYQHNV